MNILNYLQLNTTLIDLRFQQDRTEDFKEIFHAHQGIEFLYVHEGSGRVVIDQTIYEVRPETLLYFRPYQLHRIKISKEKPYVRSLITFEPHVLQDYLSPFPRLKELFQSLYVSGITSQVMQLSNVEMNNLIQVHKKRISESSASELLEMKAVFLIDFLAMLIPKWKEAGRADGPHPTTVEQIMEWVNQHYMEPFELDKLAKSVHLSMVHVSSLFRKTTGSTITEYLTARRIRQACILLKKGKLSIGEVGEAVGISNASYFCQLFKRNVGLSPHQFRKLERSER